MIGMTSVTFRALPACEIIRLAAEAKLDGIEWGSDIHVPAGELSTADVVGKSTRSAGLKVLSYGSYYRLCKSDHPAADFAPYLETAIQLGAPNIRVWAGEKSPADADDAYYDRAAKELAAICAAAGKAGVTVSTEYHRGTLTQTAEGTLRLMRAAAEGGPKTYWQPNPDVSHEKNCEELERIGKYLTNIHVFEWRGANVRHALSEGKASWRDYIRIAGGGKSTAYILEFVKDDDPAAFLRDAQTLRCFFTPAD